MGNVQGDPAGGQDLYGPDATGRLPLGPAGAGLFSVAGVPANGLGANNDWAVSSNGHLYFKTAGAWVQKI